jgi:hypothetical protein
LGLEVAQLRSELDARQGPFDCAAWDTAWDGDGMEARSISASTGVEEEWLGIPVTTPGDACNAVVRRHSESKDRSTSVNHADMAMEFVLT